MEHSYNGETSVDKHLSDTPIWNKTEILYLYVFELIKKARNLGCFQEQGT